METHDEVLTRWYADDAAKQLRTNYLLDSNSIVWDLGAYKGDWATEILRKYDCVVLAFEPVSELYEKLNQKKLEDLSKRFYPVRAAVGGTSRTCEINLLGDGSSLYENSENKETIEVISTLEAFKYCRELQYIDRPLDVNTVHLLKMNIEGAEYELLEAMIEHNLQSRFVDMQIQFHKNVENCEERYLKIREKLSETHHLTYEYPWIWENWRRN